MSIEAGRACPPSSVQDSPREPGLGKSHFHEIFRFARELEELGAHAPFQCVVTTTSTPPEEMDRKPYRVIVLRGNDPAERLLGCELQRQRFSRQL